MHELLCLIPSAAKRKKEGSKSDPARHDDTDV
jgi:hypothetical protein